MQIIHKDFFWRFYFCTYVWQNPVIEIKYSQNNKTLGRDRKGWKLTFMEHMLCGCTYNTSWRSHLQYVRDKWDLSLFLRRHNWVHRGFALAQVHVARKWQKQYWNLGVSNLKSKFHLPHNMLPKYSSTLAEGSCFLLLAPFTINLYEKFRRKTSVPGHFLFLGTTLGLGGWGFLWHPWSIGAHLLLSYCFRAAQLFQVHR